MAALPTSPQGYTDEASRYGAAFGNIVDTVLEYVPDLAWPMSVKTFARMRTDPQLAAILKAYKLPIRRATWAVDGSACREEVTADVADQFGLPILGQEARPSAARRRGVNWDEHLRLSLNALDFGHMAFERFYDTTGARPRIGGIVERMPQTIIQIMVDEQGQLEGIRQEMALARLNQPTIDMSTLVWYANEREGSAWQGQSLLRPSWVFWLLKHETMRVHATSIRRFGMGVPGFEPLPGTTPTPAQQADALRTAAGMRVGDTSGYAAPPGFQFKLQGLVGSVPDAVAFIRYCDQQMSGSALAGFLDLGSTPNGSRALGDTFVDNFILALQAVANTHAEQATGQLVVPFVDQVYGVDEPAPRLVCLDVGAEHQVTAESLALLITSGALIPDESVREFIRREYKLPTESGTTPALPPRPAVAPLVAARRARPVRAAAGDRRALTPVEAASGADFDGIQATWETALDRLVVKWGKDVTAAQVDDLEAQVRAAVESGDVEALASMSVDSGPAAALLARRMLDLAVTAAEDQAAEASAQGVTIDPGDPDDDRLLATAATVAALAAAGLTSSAARKALQVWTPGATAALVAGAVRTHLDSLTDSALRDVLGSALSTAQNDGRLATLDAAKAAGQAPEVYAASEVLDAATCGPCAAEDGHEFTSLDDAKDAYANGGYIGCDGGLRCRGIIVALWPEGVANVAKDAA